jgi:hypothetical protein
MAPSGALVRPLAGAPRLLFILAFGLASFVVIVAIRDEIHADVCRNAWNDQLGAFTQSYGSTRLDASLLLLPLVGFLPPGDPRIRATARAVRAQLSWDGCRARSGSSTRSRWTGDTTHRARKQRLQPRHRRRAQRGGPSS